MSSYVDTHLGGLPAGGAAFSRRRRAAAPLHLLPRLRRPAEASRPSATGSLTRTSPFRKSDTALALDAWGPLAQRTRYSP